MRIALVSFDFGEYCIQHANGFADQHEVLLLLPSELARPHLHSLDARVQFRPFEKPRLRQPVRQLRVVRRLHRWIHEFKPDVIHFQLGHLWFNLSLPLLRRYPLVFTIHDARQHLGDRGARNTPQSIMDFGFRRADQVIVHGQALKETVEREVGIAASRIHVIPHIAVGARHTATMTPAKEDRILFFGRIWKYKGLEYLIRAQPLVSAVKPDVRFVIAGTGERFEQYEQMMADPDKFIVHNRWISDDKRSQLFQESRIVVLPYVEASQSGVVPVASTYAKPVIATTVGALPEAVEHGQTGLLVPPGNERALAEAILQLLDDEELCRQMGARGEAKLNTQWSPTAVAQQTEHVYALAIQSSRFQDRDEPSDPSRLQKVELNSHS